MSESDNRIELEELARFARDRANSLKAMQEESTRSLGASVRGYIADIDSRYAAFEASYVGRRDVPECAAWLLDNHYLIKREALSALSELKGDAKLRKSEGGSFVFEACAALVRSGGGKVDEARIEQYFKAFQTVTALTRDEQTVLIACVRAALVALIAEICKDIKMRSRTGELIEAIGSLRLLGNLDLSSLRRRIDKVEEILSDEESGVYSSMDERSREYYRRKLSQISKKNKVDDISTATGIVERAESQRVHIGKLLFEGDMGVNRCAALVQILMYAAVTVLPIIIYYAVTGSLGAGLAAFLLSAFALSELAKRLSDYVLLHFVKSRQVLRLKLKGGVPSEGRSICVISTLLTDERSAAALAESLEKLALISRDCGKNVLYGVLADLPESKRELTATDQAALTAAKNAVDGLNAKYGGGFYLLHRARTYSETEGVWFGHERKRGAIMDLARELCEGDSALICASGTKSDLRSVRYIISLDADTKLTPNSLRELIGAMLHPNNRPVLNRRLGRVVSGHGLIHPRMCVSLDSATATYFSRMKSAQGGVDPYCSASGEIFNDVWACGGFSGKGIIDAEMLLECCKSLPEGRILSHDFVEAALLRGAYMSDCIFVDGFPTTPTSYYKRLHRWIRGDWQNLSFLQSYGKKLAWGDILRLIECLRFSLLPLINFIAVVIAIIYPVPLTVFSTVIVGVAYASRILIAMGERIFRGGGERRARYFSAVSGSFLSAVLSCVYDILFLPAEAAVSLSAIVCALWRMGVSRRGLLSWQTAAQSEQSGTGADYLRSMFFPSVIGALLTVLAANVWGAVLAALWMLTPLMAYGLSRKNTAESALSSEDRKYLKRQAAAIWRYFEAFCTKEENYLPPDNYQVLPPVGVAHRTSPTNIGLAMVSALCALDLNLGTSTKIIELLENMLSTTEKLKKWRGHLLNWYDTRTCETLSPEYVSTVDSGNFAACLLVLRAGLIEYGREDLAERAHALYKAMDFTPLYDETRNLYFIGFDVSADRLSESRYDLMASEARLTAYTTIANGTVTARHWRSLSRSQLDYKGRRGMGSWTGTMFEYLMPELFLPLKRHSAFWENANFCLAVQKDIENTDGLWGASESSFYALDSSLSYRYKAHGSAELALKRGMEADKVLSPYSAFLSLAVDAKAAIANVRAFEQYGASGEYGLYEAVDFTPLRSNGGGEVVRSFMAHHLGMSMAAITNALSDNILRKRFMADADMGAFEILLAERVPVGSKVLRKTQVQYRAESERIKPPVWEKSGEGVNFTEPACTVLSNGVMQLLLTQSGFSRTLVRDKLLYNSTESKLEGPIGFDIYVNKDSERIGLLPASQGSEGLEFSYTFSGTSATVSAENDEIKSRVSSAVCNFDCTEVRTVEIRTAKPVKGVLNFEFEPVLAPLSDYRAHPAFWRLGLSARMRENALMLERAARGEMGKSTLCVACDTEAEFSASDTGSPLGSLSSPRIRVSVPFEAGADESFMCRLTLSYSEEGDRALSSAKRALLATTSDYADMLGASAASLGMTAREVAAAMDALSDIVYPDVRGPVTCAKDALWRFGISGDLPIVTMTVTEDTDRKSMEMLVRRHALFSALGINFDLCFLTDEGGDYLRNTSRAVTDSLTAQGREGVLGARGGVHIADVQSGGMLIKGNSALVCGEEERVARALRLPPPKLPRRGGNLQWEIEPNSFSFVTEHRLPHRAWSTILTNGRFGYIASDSGGGNMWYENARECRINAWHNDLRAIDGDETLSVIHEGKRVSLFCDEDGVKRRVQFGLGYAMWETGHEGDPSASVRVRAYVPHDIDARVFIIDGAVQNLKWQSSLVMGADMSDARALSATYEDGVFTASNACCEYTGLKFRALFSQMPEGYTCDKASALAEDYDEKDRSGAYACFAAKFSDCSRLVLVCGTDELTKLEMLLIQAEEYFERTKEHWTKLCTTFTVQTPSERLNLALGGHVAYQAMACRLMARCSMYQSGGAYGYRDQLQDAANMIMYDANIARHRILEACRHQYAEGDVMHWWHELPTGSRGVRTRCSDDLLWLAWALCEYCEKTGDLSLCDETVPYMRSAVLSEHEKSRYELVREHVGSESVLQHALRAMDLVQKRGVGKLGVFLIGEGDWNDGMDKVGIEGRGDSVWLSWFYAHTAERMSKLLEHRGESDKAREVALSGEEAARAADACFENDRYLRGSYDDGALLGSMRSEGCQIDSLVQSWSAFCESATKEQVDKAMDTALLRLYDEESGIIKLFDPPFDESTEDAGYIRSYGTGFRENGGQYTHAALWFASACLKTGRTMEGLKMLESMFGRTDSYYLTEPFVIAADIYSNTDRYGEGGWSWYTGSAAWFLRVVAEDLLGIMLKDGELSVKPKLPKDWYGYDAYVTDGEGVVRHVRVRGDKIEVKKM